MRCYVEGGPSQRRPVPRPADPAPSEASQPLPCCLVCTKAGPLLCLGVFHELTQVLPAAHPFNNSNYCQTAQINSLSQDLTLKLLGNVAGFRTSTTHTARTLHSR